MMFYVYILECSDKTLYTGYTNDVHRRVEVHNAGRGAKYTRTRIPVRLVYQEALPDKSAALRREWEIKHLRRKAKLALIAQSQESASVALTNRNFT
ncbi:GIY-YIG nuclease family protein [Alicyclobacillus suci]|uniref:GIY-YIG nuclease family protein n=1 Tax=Alicyclobacillus suci TaxID=2816080 RepID=UPI001F1EA75A|nr:GIY-YIG nuclease family protein [Alicyclobacillus suci]